MIYVITHKKFDDKVLDRTEYSILHVGTNTDCKDTYLRDDVADNIALKNSFFCELTGLYWIWKNGKEKPSDITGLVHYRRFFTTRFDDILYTYFGKKPKLLSSNKVTEALKNADIILPKGEKIYRSVQQFYCDFHCAEDLNITRAAIKKVCPDYLKDYDEVMNGHYFYYANMMICSKENLDLYSQWLFELMDELEKNIDLNKYNDPYQARVFGFLSERLLQVWVKHKGLKVKEYPIFNSESRRMTIFEKNHKRMIKLFKKLKRG